MILQTLSALALRELIDTGARVAGFSEMNLDLDRVIQPLRDRFFSQGDELIKALTLAGNRAWRALELGLTGESILGWLDRADERAFRQQIRVFLDTIPPQQFPTPQYRHHVLRELRLARKDQLLTEPLDSNSLLQQTASLARFHQSHHLLQVQWQLMDRIAERVHDKGYQQLAHYLRLRPVESDTAPLLGLAVRFFFRRAIETDPQLSAGWTFSQLEGMARTQQSAFTELNDLLIQHETHLVAILDQLNSLQQEMSSLRQEVGRLDIRAEQQRVSEQVQALHRDVLSALETHRLSQRELRPRDSLSIQSESERKLVKQLVSRYRSMPRHEQDQLPALLNALARLEVATGDFDSAQRDFQQVSRLVGADTTARAEAHYNAFRTALERDDLQMAMNEFKACIELDAGRFAPFPLDRYEPIRILGAGGFGIAFQCRHRFMNALCVVKVLLREDCGDDVQTIFAEAQHLRQLNHPSIISIQDCGYADSVNKSRPYLVMDFFEATTLEEFIRRNGPIPLTEFPILATAIAEGLSAAHAKGILHRDVKPANILIKRKMKTQIEAEWEVKLIDFGLAIPQQGGRSTIRNVDSTWKRSLVGGTIAGTLDYAAPEQLGKIPGATLGTSCDVYGFGRTCAYALFQTPSISYQEWKKIEGPIADLLSGCLIEQPAKRTENFNTVLEQIVRIRNLSEAETVEDVLPVLEPVLEALPIEEPTPPKRSTRTPTGRSTRARLTPADEPSGARSQRSHADVSVTIGRHTIRAECSPWTNYASIYHDGRVMVTGWPWFEETYTFQVAEEGEWANYDVTIRGPGMSILLKPFFTIRRNGKQVYNDR